MKKQTKIEILKKIIKMKSKQIDLYRKQRDEDIKILVAKCKETDKKLRELM